MASPGLFIPRYAVALLEMSVIRHEVSQLPRLDAGLQYLVLLVARHQLIRMRKVHAASAVWRKLGHPHSHQPVAVDAMVTVAAGPVLISRTRQQSQLLWPMVEHQMARQDGVCDRLGRGRVVRLKRICL